LEIIDELNRKSAREVAAKYLLSNQEEYVKSCAHAVETIECELRAQDERIKKRLEKNMAKGSSRSYEDAEFGFDRALYGLRVRRYDLESKLVHAKNELGSALLVEERESANSVNSGEQLFDFKKIANVRDIVEPFVLTKSKKATVSEQFATAYLFSIKDFLKDTLTKSKVKEEVELLLKSVELLNEDWIFAKRLKMWLSKPVGAATVNMRP